MKTLSDHNHTMIRMPCQTALPDTYNRPTLLSENTGDATVSGLVTLDLVSPGLLVRPRPQVPTAVVAVPEASINENGDFDLGPHEIRAAGKMLVPTPPGDPGPTQQRGEALLGCHVSGTAHAGHELATA